MTRNRSAGAGSLGESLQNAGPHKPTLLRLFFSVAIDTMLWRSLMGPHLSAKTALNKLNEYFSDRNLSRLNFVSAESNNNNNNKNSCNSSSNNNNKAQQQQPMVTVCLVDELDYLITKDFNVLYNLFSWPAMHNSGLVLVGIANVMDLPEKLSPK
jgi:hypothetical protein